MCQINVSTDWVAALQRADNEILSIVKRLEEGNPKTHQKYTLCNGRVYKISKGNFGLCVPADIVSEAHPNLNHLGIDKTLSKIKECYYFSLLREFINKYINRCISCLHHKTPSFREW